MESGDSKVRIKTMHRMISLIASLSLGAISFTGMASATITVTLTPSVTTAKVGATVVWTAKATDSANSGASFQYQFSAGPSATELQVRRDFSAVNTFPWTPNDHEGTYVIRVAAQESSEGTPATAEETFIINSRVTGTSPVVSRTSHPLVALYSAPACPAGSIAQVHFRRTAGTYWYASSSKTCNGTTSMNFYVGGMRPSTEYTIQGHVYSQGHDTAGPLLTFTTGAVPSSINIEQYTVPKSALHTTYPVVLTSPTQGVPFATDSLGNLIWYLPAYENTGGYITRPVVGGDFLGVADDNSGIANNRRLLREYDMAGNLVRETNAAAISQQLTALGTDPITSVHHEVFRFPNGYTALIGSVEKVTNQGSGTVDVLGDMAIVLDSNLQVKWFWNEFDHLDITRQAILGETCVQGNPGCPHLYAHGYSVANDWTHSNSLAPTPDGDLIISIRHQDWVVKINYNNDKGNGSIIWRLGNEGDFKVKSSDPHPWFSHQHDVTFASNGLLTLFDNGNTRVTDFGGNSRGQSWRLDQANKIATSVLNLDLGAYSYATGSAELLSTGNYHFHLGFIGGTNSKTVEYTTGGGLVFEEADPKNVGYRAFRMKTLYSEQ